MVLRMRFGIDMATEMNLEEVGRMLLLTRERVRQIEATAMAQAQGHEAVRGAPAIP